LDANELPLRCMASPYIRMSYFLVMFEIEAFLIGNI